MNSFLHLSIQITNFVCLGMVSAIPIETSTGNNFLVFMKLRSRFHSHFDINFIKEYKRNKLVLRYVSDTGTSFASSTTAVTPLATDYSFCEGKKILK